MPKAETPSFVLEFPLVVKPGDERVMLGRLEAGRRLYNVVLQGALNRLKLMRESKAWQAACAMPKSTDKDKDKTKTSARNAAFIACRQRFSFDDASVQNDATWHKNAARFEDRLGAHETQKIGTRVWNAVNSYALGKKGKPRFKGTHRPLHSLEGKSTGSSIKWRRDRSCVEWDKLFLPAIMPKLDRDPWVNEALKSRVKYCRVLWRTFAGGKRWYVQLVMEGLSPQKYEFLAAGMEVGLDIGPSTIAIEGDQVAALEQFAPSVVQPWKKVRVLQRTQDRSQRAMNPDNYDDKGRIKKGKKTWKKSARYKQRQADLADLERRLAAGRKRDHGELANKVVGLGTVVKTETLSYKAFQRLFGRSVKVRAPGAFFEHLESKAARAGGQVIELDTWRLRMSQYDHVLERYEKKPLSQRWHALGGTDVRVQRDIYSAFLAHHAKEDGHNPSHLAREWAAQEPVLRRAGLCIDQSASGKAPPSPRVAISSERIARRRRLGRGLNSGV
ncbi:MAG: hypothetical protein A2286_14120 [Gammaproteobacteria bacterium RIFOXYA12_FULL_61_12]|nr:MAG: hypothetical protein A2514_07855 [Gammaproteobacteria bacterium RIFOXYD12_FULL_61_37]OGT89610.1 MAG: hypothetical protein A2286_14120 [Gammaproteobacteria bacterium RIFOXYA12_FULL_61_12]